MDQTEHLRRIVRGDVPYREAEQLGAVASDDVRELHSPSLDVDELRLADLATGFVRHWASGTELREWASLMLMLSDIQFIEAESGDEDLLLEALWSASAGEPLNDATIANIRRVAGP